jgi:hypothetical protein
LTQRVATRSARGLSAVAIIVMTTACTPNPYVTGAWRFDGRTFGSHAPPSSRWAYPCTSGEEPGSVQFELRLADRGRGHGSSNAYVGLSPLDDMGDVDVKMPWSHVRFSAAECSRHMTHGATDVYAGGQTFLRGTVWLSCKHDDNSVDLDLSYSCPVRLAQ